MQIPDHIYQFQNATIQEVTYDQISARNRRRVHGRVAEWLESEGQAESKPQLLAFHWGRASIIEKEIHYLDLAGEAALNAYANEEAVSAFRAVLEQHQKIFPTPPPEERKRRAHWERLLGEALFRTGNLGDAEKRLNTSLHLMNYSLPQSTPAVIAGIPGQLARQILHRISPGLVSTKMVLTAEEEKAGGPYEATLAIYRIGQIYYHRCQRLRGINLILRLIPRNRLRPNGVDAGKKDCA